MGLTFVTNNGCNLGKVLLDNSRDRDIAGNVIPISSLSLRREEQEGAPPFQGRCPQCPDGCEEKWGSGRAGVAIAGFGVVNCWWYEARFSRSDEGRIPPKDTLASAFTASLLGVALSLA
ncbi:uncharacterized protein LOC130140096 [Syzygium oleosum]|uniref:uncharacterized protein LOC130140096 n=1 Tax=Syzygium oleosum TaxID=219896 RepID=UPI0024BBD3B8|nr:uncharacterized protein LOC130140096 [Syzygium oleosum]